MKVRNLTKECVNQSDFTGTRNVLKSHFNILCNNEMYPERIKELDHMRMERALVYTVGQKRLDQWF